jgi:REP element-mobilizing transposase RayT
MPYDPKKHHRRSIRLKGYDYAGPGWYYLTICTFEREFLFGDIVEDQMRPSMIGAIAQECWNEIPQHFAHAALDVSVVMPNHLHGIIIIGGEVGARHGVPVQSPRHAAAFGKPVPGSLATMVGLFKQAVTKRVGARHDAAVAAESYGQATTGSEGMPWHDRTIPRGAPPESVPAHIWHENYYEHIIRNEEELDRIREYICTNPLRWPYDVENPGCSREAADDIEEVLGIDDDW